MRLRAVRSDRPLLEEVFGNLGRTGRRGRREANEQTLHCGKWGQREFTGHGRLLGNVRGKSAPDHCCEEPGYLSGNPWPHPPTRLDGAVRPTVEGERGPFVCRCGRCAVELRFAQGGRRAESVREQILVKP